MMKPEQYLGRVGLWTMQLDQHPTSQVRDAVTEIEDLGYGTIWVGEAFGREAFAQASLLLSATSKMVVATGVANIFLRHATAAASTQQTLAEAYDGRFLLGLGGHRTTDQPPMMGLPFHGNAIDVMREYLDTMDSANYMGVAPAVRPKRVLAALGPKMLALAGERSWGAHTYLVPPDHTAKAREIMGPDALLAVEQTVVVDTDIARAKQQAREFVGVYIAGARHQQRNMRRLGFTDEDMADGGSDRLVDAVVAYGDVSETVKRVQHHFDAGADHVCVQVLAADKTTLPLKEWREVAESLAL